MCVVWNTKHYRPIRVYILRGYAVLYSFCARRAHSLLYLHNFCASFTFLAGKMNASVTFENTISLDASVKGTLGVLIFYPAQQMYVKIFENTLMHVVHI